MKTSRRQFLMAAGMVEALANLWAPEAESQQRQPAPEQVQIDRELPPEATQGPWRNLRAVREKKVIDFHNHTYETPTQSPLMRGTGLLHAEGHYVDFTDQLVESMDRHGIAKCFLTPAFVEPAYETVRDTSYKKYPNRFVMGAVLRDRKPVPTIPEAAKLLRAQLTEGARGVGEGGLPGGWKSPKELEPVMDVLMEFDVPAIQSVSWSPTGASRVAAGSSPYESSWRAAERLGALAAYYPDVKWIMGHTGGQFHHLDGWEALRVAFSFDNIWCEVSKVGSPEIITEAVKGLGAEKVIYGSDWNRPQMKAYGPKHYRGAYQHWWTLNAIARADLTEDQRDMILYKNAMRLLKLSE